MIANAQLRKIVTIPNVAKFKEEYFIAATDCRGSFLLCSKRYGVLFSELFIDNILEIYAIDFEADIRLDCDLLVAHYTKSNLLTNQFLVENRSSVDRRFERIFLSNQVEKLNGLLDSVVALTLLFEESTKRGSPLLALLGRVVDKSWTAPYRQCALRAVA